GSMANGATATLGLVADVRAGTAGDTISNIAGIAASDSGDALTENNRDTVAVKVQSADLAVSMSVDQATPNEGQTINYVVALHNNGLDPASGVVVTDLLPAGLSYSSSTPSQGSYAPGTGRWTVGSIQADSTLTLAPAARVGAG